MPFLPECPPGDDPRWVILPAPYEENTGFLKGTAAGLEYGLMAVASLCEAILRR